MKKLNIPSSPWLLRLNILTCMTNSMSKATSSSFFTFVVFSRGRPRISNHEEAAAVENVEAVRYTAAVIEALVRGGNILRKLQTQGKIKLGEFRNF